MSTEKEKIGLDAYVIVGALLVLSFFGPVALSGAFLMISVVAMAMVVRAYMVSPTMGLLMMAALVLFGHGLIQFTAFRGVPFAEWPRYIVFTIVTPFVGSSQYDPVTRALIRYANHTVRFWPLGMAFWAGFALYKKWHLALVEKLGRSWRESLARKKERNPGPDVFMGIDEKTGGAVMITEEMRLRHTQVLGATGYGKTESVLLNFIHNDIQNGRGLLLIDGKGDANLRDQIMSLAETYGRLGEVSYINYSDAYDGPTYNPVMNGSDAEIRDRIMDCLEWSEVYYKKCASSALLMAVNAVRNEGPCVTIKGIVEFLTNPKGKNYTVWMDYEPIYRDFCDHHAKRLVDIKGLITDLNNIVLSGYGKNLNPSIPDIDLWGCIANRKIVVFQVSTLDYGETARIFGRLVIQDLKAACGDLNRNPEKINGLFPVYIDEFASFAHEGFNELLSKARSAGLGIHILHQSMGDLEKVGDYFKRQITENTNNKIILRVNDEETVAYFAGMGGTKSAIRRTYQVEDDVFMTRKTGMGSMREVEEYRVHPNVFRSLEIGEAVVMTRNNNKNSKVKLSRLPHIPRIRDYAEYMKERAKRSAEAMENLYQVLRGKEAHEHDRKAAAASTELF